MNTNTIVKSLFASIASTEERNFRDFYIRHFLSLKNRTEVLSKLNPISIEFSKEPPPVALMPDAKQQALLDSAENVITTYFNDEILQEFRKRILPPPQQKISTSFLESIFEGFNNFNFQKEAEWNHKKKYLAFLNNCLLDYGLHSSIWSRNQATHKKFNVIIYHFHKSNNRLQNYKYMLSSKEFDEQFMVPYSKMKTLKFGGLLIPFNAIHEVKITTTLLEEKEIILYGIKKGFTWNDDEKDYFGFINSCLDETEKYHPNPYDEVESNSNVLNKTLTAQAAQMLVPYGSASKLYDAAIKKFDDGIYERNALDDLRLCLELLLKEIFSNQKPLEKQIEHIGNLQKAKGGSSEVINMFNKLLEYYSKYQNSYIKHNDQVNNGEVEFIKELTSSFIKLIISK